VRRYADPTLSGSPSLPDASPNIRIGWGYDIHRLYDGYPTVLAGVEFPDFPRGFDTHSDGDVVAHAIIDALAGALAAGSLGDYFPEDDPADQNARSIEFLERFRPVMARHRAEVINLDCTIFCAAPRIGPAAAEMRSNIAAGIGCQFDRVNVKGKTNDGFGPEGRGEAISAIVVAQVRAAVD
jgi:2-C-methyl-D-erythritol 2,4-cyclodiphosphate synthase